MENLMAVKELERGRDFANQIRGLVFRPVDQENDDKVKGLTTSSAEDLVSKVLDSFTNTLSLFNHHHVSADSSITSSFSHHLPSNSDESHHDESPKTRRSPTSTIQDRTRSSPKKRKNSKQAWVEDSKMSPKEDGYAWRKYGQKIILNTKHPRNYFRCTHRQDQGCEATKQVQKIQDDPPLYRTTYFGHHTCTNLLNPHIFPDDSNYLNSTSAFILSFDNNHNNNNLITAFDPKINNNNNNNTSSSLAQQNHNNLSLSSNSLFPSFDDGSVKNEEHYCDDNKHEKNNKNDKINVVVPSCSSNDCLLVSPPHEEAVLPPFASGDDDDQVDVFLNSAAFYDLDLLVFEDPFI